MTSIEFFDYLEDLRLMGISPETISVTDFARIVEAFENGGLRVPEDITPIGANPYMELKESR